jgi:hypothetical protein
MLNEISLGLKRTLPAKLVDELLAAYTETKENVYTGGLRLSAVEGGRFCEATLRILEQVTSGTHTDLNLQINAEKTIENLRNLPASQHPAAIRIHIPRAVRVVYDIRNSRDNAHLADGIDPNIQDSTLVVSVLDWIMAEFVRLYHNVAADEAQKIIDSLVIRKVPAVQDFNGFKKMLNPNLQASPYILVLLYECANSGATFDQLVLWVKPTMRRNLNRTLRMLIDEPAFVHKDAGKYIITHAGMAEVERKKLHANALR